MKDKKNYLKSINYGFLQILVNVIISIMLTPFIIQNIGIKDYGLYIVITSSIQLLSFFNVGFGSALEILTSRNGQNIPLISKYKNIVLVIQLTLGITGLIIGIFSSKNLIFLGLEEKTTYVLSIIFLSLSALMVLITNVFKSIISGYRKIHIISKVGVFTSILTAITTYIFLINKTGLIGLSFNFLIMQFVTFFFTI